MKQLITRQQMEAFARSLETAKKNQVLPTDEFNALHARFRAEDAAGGVWTIGIHTAKWHRLDQGKWAPANPPESLSLDEQLLSKLQTLAPVPTAEPIKPNVETAAEVCTQCGSRIKPGKKFCASCGTPVMASPAMPVERRCPHCGQLVPARKKFCTGCGLQF
jgi:hypothetical protein